MFVFDFSAVQGRFLECISLLGASVHSERFKEDVLPVMQAMAQATNGQGMDADDPTKQFILKAWVRISKSLGEAFAPYLEVRLPYAQKPWGRKNGMFRESSLPRVAFFIIIIFLLVCCV